MLSQYSKGTAGLLSCHLIPKYRKSSIPSFLRRYDIFTRFQNTTGNSSDDGSPLNPPLYRHSTNRRNRSRRRRESKRVELGVSALGKPGEVVVVRERKRRHHLPTTSAQPDDGKDKRALPFMLEEIEKYAAPYDSAAVVEQIESFCLPYKPGDKLTLADWEDLRMDLQSSFTIRQLSEYISDKPPLNPMPGNSGQSQQADFEEWRPGRSVFLETSPVSQEGVADRVAKSQDLKGKHLLAERILRDCWQLGVMNEIGQIDIRLPPHSLSLLLGSQHFSFEELASLHEAAIDVTHSLGLVRVTGRQRSCESIREIIHDTTNRIRQEDIELCPPNEIKTKSVGKILNAEFLSWVSKIYGVAFEQSSLHGPRRMFYLHENKLDADNARRTLNLALYGESPSQIPFSTYMSASEPIAIHSVEPDHHVSWFDQQRTWFRWGALSPQPNTANDLSRAFFERHQTRLSDELLHLLRQIPSTSYSAPRPTGLEVHESVTAAVGRCLFLRKQAFAEGRASASHLGKMLLPRTFITDIPRAAHFLRMLPPHLSEDNLQTHRIRLVPSVLHAQVFPSLELEVTVNASEFESRGVDCIINSATAILEESNVDYLLPEASLDLRFTRKLAHDLFTTRDRAYPLEALQEDLRDCFNQSLISDREISLPAFTSIAIPNTILNQSRMELDSSGSTVGEYMFLPVNDIQGTRVHRYGFQDQQLYYSSYESGPFSPHMTTDLYLKLDLKNEANVVPDLVSRDEMLPPLPLQREFNSFYQAACAMAFELS